MALHIPGLGRWFKALPDLRARPKCKCSAPLLHRLEESDIGIDTYIKVGIIAGTSTSILPGRFLISEKNDGMIPITSAIAPDADAVMLTPFNHVTIHKRNETLKAVYCFLTSGHFPQEI